MYNVEFNVRYNVIETELLSKSNQSGLEYTSDDVLTICSQIYLEEFIEAFGVEDYTDDCIDREMAIIKNKLLEYSKFKIMINEVINGSSEVYGDNEYITSVIFFSLFGQPLFHITHKCICQLYKTGEIDDELIQQIKCILNK